MSAPLTWADLGRVMRRIWLAILLITLASCATTTPPPPPTVVSGVKTEKELVEVVKPCFYTDEIPKVPGTWMSETQSKEKRRLASVADFKQLEQYLLTVDGMLIGCAKPRPTGEPK